MQDTGNDIITYQSQDGKIKVDVRFENDMAWITQAQMCELFGKSKSKVSEHINNVFEEMARATTKGKERAMERLNSIKQLDHDIKQITNPKNKKQ